MPLPSDEPADLANDDDFAPLSEADIEAIHAGIADGKAGSEVSFEQYWAEWEALKQNRSGSGITAFDRSTGSSG